MEICPNDRCAKESTTKPNCNQLRLWNASVMDCASTKELAIRSSGCNETEIAGHGRLGRQRQGRQGGAKALAICRDRGNGCGLRAQLNGSCGCQSERNVSRRDQSLNFSLDAQGGNRKSIYVRMYPARPPIEKTPVALGLPEGATMAKCHKGDSNLPATKIAVKLLATSFC